MEKTFISAIIPTYKSPEALDLCLRSAIEGQQNKNQIIVVVDGFYDLNKEVLEKWSQHIDILNLEENVGLCRGTNLGVYNSQYDKILIVNDDNLFPRNWDIDLLNSYEENSVISPNQIEPIPSIFKQFKIKNLGRDPKTFDLETFWDYASKTSFELNEESGSTLPIFMNKYDYLKVGGWDENYDMGMVADWDFFLKCTLTGMKMIRTYNCHFYHFVSLTTMTPEKEQQRRQSEQNGHEYAKYKWGNYIYSHSETNLKFIL
jgi:glycosyltransferase involved in cell wall biosynthesis